MAIEVDLSSGHSAHRAGALNIKSGGMQSVPRPSKMTESCLGLGALLKPGELQYFEFREGDPPPKFESNLTD